MERRGEGWGEGMEWREGGREGDKGGGMGMEKEGGWGWGWGRGRDLYVKTLVGFPDGDVNGRHRRKNMTATIGLVVHAAGEW